MPLFSVNFPQDAFMIYGMVINIANFDILPSNTITGILFNFPGTYYNNIFY